jgi:CheY-like chemotaxis protein
MGRAQQKRRTVLIVEDDAELRSLTAALFEDKQVDTIECTKAARRQRGRAQIHSS